MKKLALLLSILLLPGLALADPISAIAAIGTMAAGAGGIGAIGGVLAGGLAGIAGLGLTGGMMFAGGALGLVGSITGNKKLQKLGGALGLAGGVGQMFQTLAGGAAAEAGKAAGAEALSQTATTPVQEIAADAAAMTAEEAITAAQNAGLGTEDLTGQALRQTEKIGDSGILSKGAQQPGAQAIERAAGLTGTSSVAEGGPSAIGKWVRDNKELVNVGGGILKGAGEAYASSQARKDAEEAEQRRRDQFNASVTGMQRAGNYVNPNADPTAGRSTRDPIRYTPRRQVPQRYGKPTGG